jgi:anti-sigma factor RsiW
MGICEDFEPRLTAFVDGALAPAEARAVEAHVEACQGCAAAVATGQAARTLLRRHAPALRTPAPAGLRARVTPAASPKVVPFRPRRPLWRLVPLSAAAALLLAALSVVAMGALGPQGTVLAAQLTLDHLKCLLLDRPHGPADPAGLAAHWEAEHGWAVDIPASAAEQHLELVGLRQCLFDGGTMAHVLYRHEGRSVSLFILPRARPSVPVLEIMGHETIVWQGQDRTYALVVDEPSAGSRALAAYLAARAR